LPLKTHTFSDTEEAALISLIAESKRFISTINPKLSSKYDREVQQLKKISEVVNCFGKILLNHNSSNN
jgi:hemerythrin superfamily protein